MKALRRYIDKIKPNYEKGGKREKWLSVFESFETFLFVPGTTTKKGAHIRDAVDLKRTMTVVVLALVPALLFGMWNTGFWHFESLGEDTTSLWGNFWYGFLKILPLIVISYAVGLGTEFVFVYIRGHEINEGFLVSGLLIPMIVPVDVPLWQLTVATIFAVVIGKEAFGGTGMNILNPALLARAFLFFAYPSKMSGDTIWIAGLTKGEGVVDGFSGATGLAEAAAGHMDKIPSASNMFFGFMPGSVGETSTLAILIGAAFLLITGIGSLRIMASVFIGGLGMGLLFNAIGINQYMEMPFYYHILLGGFAFGAVFMATDPVTASQTKNGKIIYGLLIGILAVLIRVLNPAYPEGMMLAILLMNVFAPLIDHYVVQNNIKKRLKRVKVKA
ncbi:MAG: NADH:ubiquinone reductase (Na(+)-transporting) subunit B [Saprospiraceae bacterium]|nr:NADH:ubiquinone reductase (Na(+)-transporting) subunit B [Saprospiraceae bacterium]